MPTKEYPVTIDLWFRSQYQSDDVWMNVYKTNEGGYVAMAVDNMYESQAIALFGADGRCYYKERLNDWHGAI